MIYVDKTKESRKDSFKETLKGVGMSPAQEATVSMLVLGQLPILSGALAVIGYLMCIGHDGNERALEAAAKLAKEIAE